MKWRQIVKASDGMEGDIGETGGEVKLGEFHYVPIVQQVL